MPTRRTLLISGASTINTALLSPRSVAAQHRLKPLKPGSRIRVVTPGTWMDPDTDLQALRERCDQQRWHLEIPAVVTRQWRYFSGTDQERVQDLRSAWNDPTVDAVVTLGGNWGGPSMDPAAALRRNMAMHGGFALRTSGGAPAGQAPRRRGIARGPFVVTNLTVATQLIGTPWLPSLKGGILILEEVGEAPYRVDRMLTQQRNAALLQQLAGVACGRFSWAEDDILHDDSKMEEILEERLGDLGIPLLLNLRLGHGRRNQAVDALGSAGATQLQPRPDQPDGLIGE